GWRCWWAFTSCCEEATALFGRGGGCMHFLTSRYALAGTLVLLVQAGLFYGASRGEKIPQARKLDYFPERVDDWRMIQRGVIEKDVQQVLRADDTLTRLYAGPG